MNTYEIIGLKPAVESTLAKKQGGGRGIPGEVPVADLQRFEGRPHLG
jgi:hypothetical protein